MVRIFDTDAKIQNTYPTFFDGAVPLQAGRLLPKGFVYENRKVSSKERWLRTYLSFLKMVRLCFWIFESSVQTFWSYVVTETRTSDGKVSGSWHQF